MGSTRVVLGCISPFFLLAALGCSDPRLSLILGATTSTYDSGLLDVLMQQFGDQHPELAVRTIVVGSGEALELGRRGDVDILIVHAPAAEARFAAEGHVLSRVPLMTNDFVIVGPVGDPAAVSRFDTPGDALAAIAQTAAERPEVRFVSRGDSSGTHEREMALWRLARVAPVRPWYLETGQGQATSLQIANERQGYALTDRATYDALSGILDLVPLFDDHATLENRYSIIVPTRAAHPDEAAILADWLTSNTGLAVIQGFRIEGADRPLFRPAPAEMADSARSDADSETLPEDSVAAPLTSTG